MRVSIVVPTWGRERAIKRLIKSIRESTPKGKYEVVVVSSDQPKTKKVIWLKKQKDVTLLLVDCRRKTESRRKSIYYYINLGVKASRLPWILMLNDDVVLDHNWYTELINVWQEQPKTDIGMIIANFQMRGIKQNLWLGKIKKAGHGWEDVYMGDFALIRNDIIKKIGYFDENLDWIGCGGDNVMAIKFLTNTQIIMADKIIVNHLPAASVDRKWESEAVLSRDCQYLKQKWDKWCREHHCQYQINLEREFWPRLKYYLINKIRRLL